MHVNNRLMNGSQYPSVFLTPQYQRSNWVRFASFNTGLINSSPHLLRVRRCAQAASQIAPYNLLIIFTLYIRFCGIIFNRIVDEAFIFEKDKLVG